MDQLIWSEWVSLNKSCLRFAPDKPGIYEIRTDYEFGRLLGRSRIVYVGRTKSGSLYNRISKRVTDPWGNLSWAEKFLHVRQSCLEFRCTEADSDADAKRLEAYRLYEYYRIHGELPPGNSTFPEAGTSKAREFINYYREYGEPPPDDSTFPG